MLAAKDAREAARQAGIPERTIYTWMSDPVFRTALSEAEGRLIDDAARKLLRYQDAAVSTVLSIMANPGHAPSVRLRAAQTILDQLFKLRELRSVEERLTALENNTKSD